MKIVNQHTLGTYIITNRYREQSSLIGKILPFFGIVAGLFLFIVFGDVIMLSVISMGLLLLYIIVPCVKYGISRFYYKINESYLLFEKDGISIIYGAYTISLQKNIIDSIIIRKKYLRIKVTKGQDLYVLVKDQDIEHITIELKKLDYNSIVE